MLEDLELPAGLDGRVVRHVAGDGRVRAHRHAELEVNLAVSGTRPICSGSDGMSSLPAR